MNISLLASKVLPDCVELSPFAALAIEVRVIAVARGLASSFNLGMARGKQGIDLVTFAVYRIFKREMFNVIIGSIKDHLRAPANLKFRLVFSVDLAGQFGFEPPDQDTSEIFVGCLEYVTCEILSVASARVQRTLRGTTITPKDVVAAIVGDRELGLCITRSKEASR